jgi:phosphoribosylformylglycinamidine cyclo-ligase
MTVSYREAGVDLDLADAVTARITARLGNNLFGGLVPVPQLKGYDEPVLVSSIDGIGTKVRLAARLGRLEWLGEDIVHHCVNDIACQGATPLFFLDYLAFGRLEPGAIEALVSGIAAACDALGIALAGGETAEMPLVYPAGHFDVAGAVVGVVERASVVDGSTIAAGDVLLGLPSSGLHTNGYSLVQKLLSEDDYQRPLPGQSVTVGEALLAPHRCYLRDISHLTATGMLHGLAHITGGGISGNLARIIPPHLEAEVSLPPLPPLFAYLQSRGIEQEEMRRVFNLGVGLIAVCDSRVLLDLDRDRYQVLGIVRQSTSKRRVGFHDGD